MPRKSRTKPVAEHIEQQSAPAEHDPVMLAAAAQATPVEPPETSFNPAELEVPTPAKERSTRRGVLAYHFRDGATIEMVDHGGKIGVHFAMPGGGKPAPEVLETVKLPRTHGATVKSGLTYDAKEKSWMKRISDNPIGDRLEVEARTKLAAERYLEGKNLDGASRG